MFHKDSRNPHFKLASPSQQLELQHASEKVSQDFAFCAAQSFLRQLAQSLEAAMQQHQEPGAGRKQVVHAVQLVRAAPFYGYHPDERLFIKIVLYNPGQVTRIATLLQVSKTHAC